MKKDVGLRHTSSGVSGDACRTLSSAERKQAEMVLTFGEDLLAMLKQIDSRRISSAIIDRWNAIPGVERLDTIADAIRDLGDRLCREDDEAAEEFACPNCQGTGLGNATAVCRACDGSGIDQGHST